ncbi:aspartyl protease family protein [Aliiglaciecola sp. CAU 1673]|uniref:aspartyl protease family protein n=1 Tax=Aliiglaciecola sp. CAU 1673 TaxID=3032595 RepID=UPI0023DB9E10|nr:aspartyl protease family protein [Aliiglaciecola sp. CAU 1673]MDF2179282.1 aspartyl protease family protein [Aliiglaciecola sp. CAU 1673]
MKQSLLAAALLSVSAISMSTPIHNQAVELDLAYTDDGHAYIHMGINQISNYPMIVDTGANIGVLPTSLQATLALPEDKISRLEVQAAVGSSSLLMANIDTSTAQEIEVSNLPYVFQDMSDLTNTKGEMLGVVGYDFLSKHCVVFNFTTNKLKLSPAGCQQEDFLGLRQADFRLQNNLVIVNTWFNGKEIDAILDTGAPESLINGPLHQQLNVPILESAKARGLHDSAVSRQKLAELEFKLGNHAVSDDKVSMADLPVFAALGYKDKPVMLLGLSYFKNSHLVVDYRNHKIYF